jgi:hypothetical protein
MPVVVVIVQESVRPAKSPTAGAINEALAGFSLFGGVVWLEALS